MSMQNAKDLLKLLLQRSLEKVSGVSIVTRELADNPRISPTRIIAIGKAAVSMYEGCQDRFSDVPGFVVTKVGHGAISSQNAEFLESAHPVPDNSSLYAGERLVSWLSDAQVDDRLLLLISGGASSLVEKLRPGMSLNDLRAWTSAALADGSPIEAINAKRVELSEIKGGKLLSTFVGSDVDVLAISDVVSDGIDLIGSGLAHRGAFRGRYTSKVLTSNRSLRQELAQGANFFGFKVRANEENMSAPLEEVVQRLLAQTAQGEPGIYIFGGEPTLTLPEAPGIGGRAQAMALHLARSISGRREYTIMIAGSDGSDGVSEAAGAIVDGETFGRLPGGEEYILRADSGTFFHKTGEALYTGPTGTNVADVAVVLKHA
ncbi:MULTISPECIES: DUF4147 domain-containing protein [unclassified Sinorhizobium]|uniref:DUF4147 domain-containing protein n=1 Tax=unclassified Sinorhizobium TaxID=2613772 RepID=UPI00352467C0